jgi:hypothetical protein
MKPGRLTTSATASAMAALVLVSACAPESSKENRTTARPAPRPSTGESLPPPSAAPPRATRLVKGKCRRLTDNEFSAFAKMHVSVAANGEMTERDEVWDLGCLDERCELARMDAEALAGASPLEAFAISAWRATITAHHGEVYQLKILGMADQHLTVDLARKRLTYRQVFKTGDVTTAEGSCADATIGRRW